MKLVIVESPKKTQSIGKILGNEYIVLGCGGHFMDLQNGKNGFYGVDIENNFEPSFEHDPTKGKFISRIRDEIRSKKITKDDIYLATDDDREGEAIAWHLARTLSLDLSQAKRMIFHSITGPAIKAAINNPSKINLNRVNSALARQVTDKVVGYEISPILWRQIGRGLSAGRVQSVVTRMVVDLEKEIEKFASKGFFIIEGCFDIPFTPTLSTQVRSDNQDSHKEKLQKMGNQIKASYDYKPESYEIVHEHFEVLQKLRPDHDFILTSIINNKSEAQPPAPFITSTLQQECSNRFGYSPKITMSLAQSLYEKGLITYMRTDSSILSKEAFELAQIIIESRWGKLYYRGKQYSTVAQGAQEAHEAIRPTNLNMMTLDDTTETREIKLYELIWKRTVASQMSPEQLLRTMYEITPITNERKIRKFIHKRIQTTFPGFKILYQPLRDSEDEEDTVPNTFPYHLLSENQNLRAYEIGASENITEAVSRFTEASLIKKMEKDGIGRPSTWASMIEKIQDKGYVEKRTIQGKDWSARNLTINFLPVRTIKETVTKKKTKTEKNKLVPTDLGMTVTEFLEKEFSEIMDYKFTAEMETGLDLIYTGRISWQDLVRSYWNILHPKLDIFKQKELPREKNIRASKERFLGFDPKTNQKIYATIARYGACIRRDPITANITQTIDTTKTNNMLIKPIITMKPNMTPKITIKSKDPVITDTQKESLRPEITIENMKFNPIENSSTLYEKEHKSESTKSEYWAIDKNKGQTLESITLEDALQIIQNSFSSSSKGRNLGMTTNGEIRMKKGKYGFYLEFNKKTKSISEVDAETITLERAIELFEQDKSKDKSRIKRHITGIGDLVSGKYGAFLKLEKGGNLGLQQLRLSETAFLQLSDEEVKTLVESEKIKPRTNFSGCTKTKARIIKKKK